MKDDDLEELNNLLEPLKNLEPRPLQIKNWQRAVRKENQQAFLDSRQWMALAAGLLIGILSATIYFKSTPKNSAEEENLQANATLEWISNKSE